ncbi:MAG TPA: alpha/beta fold hydrolase [Chloroflexota bacterium]|jgi:pimeloyl-ACP methyl ester carboxylesterase
MSQATTRHVSVGDLDVAYRLLGQGDPLVLITGLGATMDLWDSTFLDALAAHYTVVIFDNRGLGGTTAPPQPFTIEQLADDAEGLIRALGLARAHVLGYSMGGYVAQELALRHPRRVTRLVLLGSGCGGAEGILPRPEVQRALTDLSGSLADVLGRVVAVLVPEDWSRDHRAYLESILTRPPAPPSPESMARQQRAMARWPGTYERLPHLSQPTLVLTGTADQVLVPANALLLVNRVPGAWLAQFPGGGHGMQYQYPRQLAATIHAFLEAP